MARSMRMCVVLAVVVLATLYHVPTTQAGCPSGSSYISVATKFNANDYCASSDYCYNCNWGCGCHSKLIYNNGGNNQYLIRAKRSAFSSTQIPSGKVLSSAYGTFRLGYNYYSRTIYTALTHEDNEIFLEKSVSAQGCGWCCKTYSWDGKLAKDLTDGLEGWTRGDEFKVIHWASGWIYWGDATFYWCTSNRHCPAGQYYSSSSCLDCPSGKYQEAAGDQTSCKNCPARFYGRNQGETNVNCQGLCDAGYYCPAGSKTNRPSDSKCKAGRHGEDPEKNVNRDCTGPCAAGYYCPEGSETATPAASKCEAGYWGKAGADYSATGTGTLTQCEGQCDAGYVCRTASTSSKSAVCWPSGGKAYYCPAGSGSATLVDRGFQAVGSSDGRTNTKQDPCPMGYYCETDGVAKKCKAGYFDDVGQQFSSTCRGPCDPGHFCRAGSTNRREYKCSQVGSTELAANSALSACSSTPTLCYCDSGTAVPSIIASADRGKYYTVPSDGPEDRREDVSACPPENECKDGKKLAAVEFSNCADGATARNMNENVGSTSSPVSTGVPLTTKGNAATDRYAIESVSRPSGCSGGDFRMPDNTKGEILGYASVDFEACPYFIVRVSVTDARDTVYCDVTVNINDQNDDPTINNCANREIEEDAAELANIGDSFTVTDPDRGQAHTWTIETVEAAGSGLFKINPCSGQLQLKSPTLDYETKTSYTMTIKVTDDGDTGLSDTCNLVINILNANDPPSMSKGTFSFSISEAAGVGDTVGTVTATDPEGLALSYYLDRDDSRTNGAFAIGLSTGKVTTKIGPTGGTKLDYEDQISFELQVRVADDKDQSDYATVSITILNANDPPAMVTPAAFYVPEDASSGTEFGARLFGTDEDFGDADSLTFAKSSGTVPFAVASNGQLSVSGSLNYEAKSSYTFKVRASDAAGATSNEVTLTVNIEDRNEAPTFDAASYSFTVSEDKALGAAVGSPLTVSDPDSGQVHLFSVLAPADVTGRADGAAVFTVDPTSGQVKVSAGLDFETTTQYRMRVKVKDNHPSPLTAEVYVNIDVTDANEAPTLLDASRSIPENSAVNTNVGAIISGSDVDGDTLSFSIAAGNSAGIFKISTAGQLQVADSTPLDAERYTSIPLTIRATDPGGLSSSALVTVTVTNVNEAPEFLTEGSAGGTAGFARAVPEFSDSGTLVGSAVRAGDPDTGDTVSYSIVAGNSYGGTNDYFAISAAGQVSVAKKLPSSAATFRLTLRATDGGGESADELMDISLTDTNAAPSCPDSTRTISELASVGTNVGSPVAATDPDTGETDTLTFELLADSNPGGIFAIGENSGQITIAKAGLMDFEGVVASYALKVRVTDHPVSSSGAPAASLTDEGTITVTVTDANEAPTLSDVTLSISENTAKDTAVGAAIAGTDPDAADAGKLTYAIVDADPTGTTFRINSATGQVYVNEATLDKEARGSYKLWVRATDTGSKTDVALVTVLINDVNEPPKLLATPDFTVNENTALFSSVGTAIRAADPDAGDAITFSLTDGGLGVFSIDSASGQITLQKLVNFEAKASYPVTVTVTDKAGETDTASFTILIGDLNESPTVSIDGTKRVNENSAAGTLVGSLTVSDPDAADTTWSFVIAKGNNGDAFEVASNGEIYVKRKDALDHEDETKNSYTLTISATDKGGLSDSTDVVVIVDNVNEQPRLADIIASVEENSPAGTRVTLMSASDPDSGDTLTYSLVGVHDHFEVVGDALQVKAGATINYEDLVAASYKYSVTVKVTDAGGATDHAVVTINVVDVNERPTVTGGTRYVDENSAVFTTVGDVIEATDPDRNQILLFSIVPNADTTKPSDTAGIFKINSCSGQIEVNKRLLNFEGQNEYWLTVQVKDDGSPSQKHTAMVKVMVNDINEAPVFLDVPLSVPENSDPDTNVGAALSITDPDAGDSHTFRILSGNTDDAFKVVGNQLKVNRPVLNFESTVNKYSLLVEVADAGDPQLKDIATVTVSLTNVNERPSLPATTISVNENSPIGSNVGAPVKCNDVDAPVTSVPLRYAITSAGVPFQINSETGQVTATNPAMLNHEATPSYAVTITCTDDDPTGALTGSGVVTIEVADVNEAPSLTGGERHVAENSPAGTAVGDKVVATDVDHGQILTYKIGSQSVNGVFRINPLTGQIEVSSPELDYDSVPRTYTVEVQVSDSGTPTLSAGATFTVVLDNVNEKPVLPRGEERELLENSAVGVEAGRAIVAQDPDAGESLKYTFDSSGLGSGDPEGLFAIGESSGIISVRIAQVDREKQARYNLNVKVTDRDGLSDVATVALIVKNVNEEPFFPVSSYKFAVPENAGVGDLVGRTVADDVDVGDVLSYSFFSVGASADTFAINSVTGDVTVNNPAKLPATLVTYSLLVQVADAAGLRTTVGLDIEVVDKNDPPVIADTTRSVNENSVVGSNVGAPVTGTDVDSGQELAYSIIDGNHNDAFSIDAVTGQIKVRSFVLNFEDRSQYKLTVLAKDNGAGELTDACTVTVNIGDVNEKPSIGGFVFSIPEMSVAGSAVGTIHGSDVDAADAGKLKLTIASGNVGNAFYLNPDTGALAVQNSILDHEGPNPSYSLRVVVTDTSGAANEATVTVTITNLNDKPILNDASRTVNENSADGTHVGAPVVASDQDQGQTITYSIIDGNANDAFAVQSDGQIVVNNMAALNHEALTEDYKLTIKAEDDGGSFAKQHDTAVVTIKVADVNEAPVFPAARLARSVPENSVNGLPITGGVVVATDVDAGQTLSYSIAGGHSVFALNPVTGQITVKKGASLDHEVDGQNSYELEIIVRDDGTPQQDSSVFVDIAVTDVNEAPSLDDTTRSVPENSDAGVFVGSALVAFDEDDGQELKYTITAPASQDLFVIDPTTGQITVAAGAALDHEATDSYSLTVRVSDQYVGAPLTDDAKITIMVSDVNEAPTINDAGREVEENSPEGTLVGEPLPATDPDQGQLLFYEIIGGNTGNPFKMDPCNGQIIVHRGDLLDFETQSIYTLKIKVTDNGDPQLSDDADVTITLVNVNERPEIKSAKLAVDENSAVNTNVGAKMEATDADTTQTLSFEIVKGDTDDAFGIKSTGQIYVTRARLDHEKTDKYELTIRVTDNGVPPMSAEAIAEVDINDVNEAPVFEDAARAVAENSAVGTLVGNVLTCADQDEFTIFKYRLINPPPAFSIVSATGQIKVAKSTLDYEGATNVYTLEAGCSDGELETTADVTVTLSDVNEKPVMPNLERHVNENVPISTAVGPPVSGSDVDSGQTLSYLIESGNSEDIFALDADTGQVTVRQAGKLNYEGVKNTYLLTIRATDDGAGALRDTGVLTIIVDDVNDSPTFPETTSRSVAENSAVDTPVGEPVLGADEDGDAVLTYSITGGTGRERFAIGASSGVITTVDASLNHEETASFTLVVTVKDEHLKSAWGTVTIAVSNVNEAPVIQNQERSVREKMPVDTPVGSPLVISDQDLATAAGDKHRFVITAGNDAGKFKLVDGAPQIFVAKADLDAQVKSLYTLTVQVTDDGGLTAEATVAVTVFDQNDPPVMTNHKFSINENSPAGTQLGTPVTGTDPEGQTLTYRIAFGNVDNVFNINPVTAQITVAADKLDKETRSSYTLKIEAQDDGPGRMTGTGDVEVTIVDVNESPSMAPATRRVDENVGVGTLIGEPLAGTDPDAAGEPGGTLSYRIVSGNLENLFTLEPSTGQLSVLQARLDHEREPSYKIMVEAKDLGSPPLAVQAEITIVINNKNDKPSMEDYAVTVNENQPKGAAIGSKLEGYDQDNFDYLTYTLSGANCWHQNSGEIRFFYSFLDQPFASGSIQATLRVKAATGALIGLSSYPIDVFEMYEISLGHETQIRKGTKSLFKAIATTADIISDDVYRDFWVDFDYTSGVIRIGQGRVVGSAVILSWTDPSPTDVSRLGFSTEGGVADFTSVCYPLPASQTSAEDVFEVQTGSGQILMKEDGLDYEDVRFFSFQVTATDDGEGTLSADAIVRVDVRDVNEAPYFVDDCADLTTHVGCFAVPENSGDGTAVASVNSAGATYPAGVYGADPDTLDGQTVTYHLLPTGNVAGAFKINKDTGAITVAKGSLLNHEGPNPVYELTVAVRDSFITPIETYANVRVTVTDVNEAPVILDTGREVRESTATVGIDDDSSVVGTLVGAPIVASDVDDPALAIGTLQFAITAGNDAGRFAMDSTSGQISVADASLNREDDTRNYFELTVKVTDGGSLFDTATVAITVTDVNEPPVIEDATREVAENSPEGTLIGLPLPSSDVDIGQSVTYSITGGDGRGAFKVSPCSGQLEVVLQSELNYEVKQSYTLVITVTDDGFDPPRLQDSAVVTLNILDINEAPVVNDQTRDVDENSLVDVLVGAIIPASDPDTLRGDVLTYSIIGGNDLGFFKVDGATGQIMVAKEGLDYESPPPAYDLIVKVVDDGTPQLSDIATVHVDINDVNERPNIEPTSRQVSENTPVGTLIGSPLVATDVEVAQGRQTLKYSIIAGNTDGAYAVNAATGQLSVAKVRDHEQEAERRLTVEVEDDGPGQLADSAEVVITVLDVNEAPTVNDAAISVNENTPLGTLVGAAVTASDPEGLPLKFEIAAGDSAGVFAIGESSGQITVFNALLDHETTPSYTLTVKVTDQGTQPKGVNKLVDTATVIVTVVNVNEQPVMLPFARNVDENSAMGTPVGDPVYGTDVDVSTNDANLLAYTLANPEGFNFFSIDASGQIRVAQPGLNHEAANGHTYTVQITATDPGGLAHTSATVITVNNVPEGPTFVSATPADMSAHELSDEGDIVCTTTTPPVCSVAATDVDKEDKLTYTIVGSKTCAAYTTDIGSCTDSVGVFRIDPVTAIVHVADNSSSTEFRSPRSYILTIRVTDKDGLTAEVDQRVLMSSVNLPPRLPHQVTLTVPENSAEGTMVTGEVVATDSDVDDQGRHDTLTYTIGAVEPEAGADYFEVVRDGTLGNGGGARLRVKAGAALDTETVSAYAVTIQVQDNGSPRKGASAQYIVTIEDVNEHPVVAAQVRHVPENSPVDFNVGLPLMASDVDRDSELSYSIASRDGASHPFKIDAASGQMMVATADSLNFEDVESYALTVTVSDGSLTDSADLDIMVNNVNEPPTILPQTMEVVENSPLLTVVGIVVASDVDAVKVPTELTYRLDVVDQVNNNADELFFIGSREVDGVTHPGVIQVKADMLDFEHQESYTMRVTVTDDGPGDAKQSASTTITVNLLDVNDLTIEGFSLSGAEAEDVEFSTNGGTWVTLLGTNMGKTSAVAVQPVVVAKYQSYIDDLWVGPEYTATDCRISAANTRIQCKTVEGIGSNLVWTVTVGTWTAKSKLPGATSYITCSYKAPTIDEIVGAGALITRGGEQFTIRGANFGPVGAVAPLVQYTPTGLDRLVYRAKDCSVSVAHEEITCTSVAGVGSGLRFTVAVPDASNRLVSDRTASPARYATPVIDSISSAAAATGANPDLLNTVGGEQLLITGSNFGPAVAKAVSAKYGPTSSEFTATTCEVTTDHTAMICSTAPGVGAAHTWKVDVGGIQSAASTSTTTYKSPVITSLSGAGYINANTQGGQPITITGSQFGPSIDLVAIGYSVADARYGGAEASGYKAVDCTVTGAHTQITCITAPGTGFDHAWQITIGDQTSNIYDAKMSYAAPVIVAFHGEGASDAQTPGGEVVEIEGRQFGFLDSKVQRVSYGENGDGFVVTSACTIVTPHSRIRCTTTEGAGRGLKWVIIVDGQESGAPTTFYEPPTITALTGDGASGASTNGGQAVRITGKNFGPAAHQEFLQFVSYGPTGLAYTAHISSDCANPAIAVSPCCTIVDHFSVDCNTVPGVGPEHWWYVTVQGQTNPKALVSTSYAPPVITHLSATTGSTVGNTWITVTGTDFGLRTALQASRTSKFSLRWQGVDLAESEITNARLVDATDGTGSTVAEADISPTTAHAFQFRLPEATEHGATRSVQVVVCDLQDRCVESDPVTFKYDDPMITGVYPVNNRESGLKELQIEGMNFGTSGRVEVTNQDGVVSDVSCHFDDGRGYMYDHGWIVCRYDEFKGSVVVHRGDQSSNSLSFEHRAPQIANLESQNMPNHLKFYKTKGGDRLTVTGYDMAQDSENLKIFVADEACPLIGDIVVKETALDTEVTVECIVPPGQGYEQQVRVESFGQKSAGSPVNYEIPFIAAVEPNEVPTSGLDADGNPVHIMLYGSDFGNDTQAVFVVDDITNAVVAQLTCEWTHSTADCLAVEGAGKDKHLEIHWMDDGLTDNPLGVYRHADAIDEYNVAARDNGIPTLELGDKPCPAPEVAVPQTQRDCNGREDGERIPFFYKTPRVTNVIMPNNPTTEGGFTVRIQGTDFGKDGNDIRVVFKDPALVEAGRYLAEKAEPYECPVTSHTHNEVQCTMPPGHGEKLEVEITVAGLTSTRNSQHTFTYKKPSVTSITPTHAPSSGLDANGDRIIMNVTGENFGLEGKVWLHFDALEWPAERVSIDCEVVYWSHRVVSVYVPADQGQNRVVEVETGTQTSVEQVTFDYDAPVLGVPFPDTTNFRRIDDHFPTRGNYIVTIPGTSLGVRDAVVYIDGVAMPGVAGSQKHTELQFMMQPGIGAKLDLYVVLSNRSTTSQTIKISYDPPRIDFIRPFPASANGERIQIFGANFGAPSTSSKLALQVNGDNCTDARVVKAANDDDEDFLECELPRQVLGWKNITIDVARQVVDYNDKRVLRTECPKGEYGQDGENCLPCPRGASCPGGSHVVWPHMFAEPMSDPKWWLKNVTDELTKCPAERLESRTVLKGVPNTPHCPFALPCEPSWACDGNNTCSVGYTGERCADCALRFYRAHDECIKCPDNPLFMAIGFVVGALCLCIGGYFLNKKSVNLAFMSIGVDYFQILALFAHSRVTWPPFIKKIWHIMSVFNFNLEIMAPECTIPDLGYKTKWMFVMALPLAALFIFAIVYVFQLCRKVLSGRRKKLHSHASLLVATYLVLFYYLYLYVTRTVLDVFNCAPTDPDDGHTYLSVHFERCDLPDGIHMTLLPLAIPALLVYVCGYPILMFTLLYRNRNLIMEDQLLRAMEVPNSRLENPHAYDVRKRYHKMYYHFKPDYYYWILAIIGRKFAIAWTALMFNRNAAFQLSIALLLLFTCYVLQVRNTPFMSMSEHTAVLIDHERKAMEGNRKHQALKTTLGNISRRGRRKARKFDWNNPDAGQVMHAAANFFWNYNTVEAVLLACAILVTLAGIMFESGRFESEYYHTQRDLITVAVILVVFISIAYFLLVFCSEVYTTACQKRIAKKNAEKLKKLGKTKMSMMKGSMMKSAMGRIELSQMRGGMSMMGGMGSMVAGNPLVMAGAGGGQEEGNDAAINPMFLKKASKADAESLFNDAGDQPPDAASWAVIKQHHQRMQKELADAKKQLQQYEAMRMGAPTAVHRRASLSSPRKKKQFGQRRMAAGRGRGRGRPAARTGGAAAAAAPAPAAST